jgi:drug/metabolite transporter (DMT)-like permease
MVRLLIILLIGLTFESTGIVLLKKGMTAIGSPGVTNAAELGRVMKAGVTNTSILLGILFEAVFFACLLVLMNRSDISFLWPLTALSFVFATFAAMMFLGEKVSSLRWVGVVLIMAGAACISYSEHAKPKDKAVSPPGAGAAR